MAARLSELLSPLVGQPAPWLLAALGLALLLAGRRLFWLLLGLAGFVAGVALAVRFAPTSGEPWPWLLGALAGLAGMALVLLLQRLAITLAGFLVGGWLGLALAPAWLPAGWPPWAAFALVGAVVALLAGWLFEWALIVLSSVAGGLLLCEVAGLAGVPLVLVLPVLTLLGLWVQARGRRARSDRSL